MRASLCVSVCIEFHKIQSFLLLNSTDFINFAAWTFDGTRTISNYYNARVGLLNFSKYKYSLCFIQVFVFYSLKLVGFLFLSFYSRRNKNTIFIIIIYLIFFFQETFAIK